MRPWPPHVRSRPVAKKQVRKERLDEGGFTASAIRQWPEQTGFPGSASVEWRSWELRRLSRNNACALCGLTSCANCKQRPSVNCCVRVFNVLSCFFSRSAPAPNLWFTDTQAAPQVPCFCVGLCGTLNGGKCTTCLRKDAFPATLGRPRRCGYNKLPYPRV